MGVYYSNKYFGNDRILNFFDFCKKSWFKANVCWQCWEHHLPECPLYLSLVRGVSLGAYYSKLPGSRDQAVEEHSSQLLKCNLEDGGTKIVINRGATSLTRRVSWTLHVCTFQGLIFMYSRTSIILASSIQNLAGIRQCLNWPESWIPLFVPKPISCRVETSVQTTSSNIWLVRSCRSWHPNKHPLHIWYCWSLTCLEHHVNPILPRSCAHRPFFCLNNILSSEWHHVDVLLWGLNTGPRADLNHS